jgi:hypothetical protein
MLHHPDVQVSVVVNTDCDVAELMYKTTSIAVSNLFTPFIDLIISILDNSFFDFIIELPRGPQLCNAY